MRVFCSNQHFRSYGQTLIQAASAPPGSAAAGIMLLSRHLLFHNGDNITGARASIAFPDDFDANSLSSNIAFVGIFSNAHANGTAAVAEESGDIYKVVFNNTLFDVDLNVRDKLQPSAFRY